MATNTTTLFDLNQTASAAAIAAMGKDALGVESIKLEAFTSAGHDRADFSTWESYFSNTLNTYITQKKTLSPAAKAAAAAASGTAAPATPATAATSANKTAAAKATTTTTTTPA